MADDTRMISARDAIELMNERKFKPAIALCDEILALMPENATAICVRERCRWESGVDPNECLAGMQRAKELAPDSPLVRTYMATIMISAGRLQAAGVLLEEALAADPDNALAFSEYAEITRFRTETDQIRHMRDLHDRGALSPDNLERTAFALAKAYSDLGEAERAMHYCMAGNNAAQRQFDSAGLSARAADLRALCDAGLTGAADSGYTGPGPIFIVGMPRSGTTLVETILSRHPEVHAAGEMAVLPVVEFKVRKWLEEGQGIVGGVHTMLPHVPREVWTQNATRVVDIVGRRTTAPFSVYTDKLPDNARRLPLISRLFPQAPIIYVRRHPLDTCISNLFKRFTHLEYTFRQDWLGQYYRDLSDAVALSRQIIPNPVLDLSYELLVTDPEAQTRRLVEFAGLAWNEACLTPEQSDRATVMTASRWQVRQPIYQSSTARWRQFEPWIGELIEAMGGMDWITAQAEEAERAGAARTR